MTLTELAMMKKAAVLIPSPNVVADHQYENAKVLADAGAAVLIREPSRKSGEQMNYAAVTQAVESAGASADGGSRWRFRLPGRRKKNL